MHYNQFTINYVEAIKRNLKIQIRDDGKGIFKQDSISVDDISNLKTELESIWKFSNDSISIVNKKYEARIQSGLFGLVNEFENALKIGFLLGDRVVLIDYLYERLLAKNDLSNIDINHLGIIASSLVTTLPLAMKGRVVIIPNPFNWYPGSKTIMQEVSERIDLTVEMIELLNMLSITKFCQLHPYTIAESDSNYQSIVNGQIDTVDAIGRDGSNYAYKGILGALLSEKLLNNVELKYVLNVPLVEYYNIISSNEDFYTSYLSTITSGGSLSGDVNIDKIRKMIIKGIKERNKKVVSKFGKALSAITGIGGGVVATIGGAVVLSAPITIFGAALGLSSTLFNLLNSGSINEDPIISVFKQLKK